MREAIEKVFLKTKSGVVEKLNYLRREIKELFEGYQVEQSSAKKEEIFKKRRAAVEEREHILTHYRGYELASKLDLSKIRDWEKLFLCQTKK